MRRIVCDTGPILHLHEAAVLKVLEKLGQVCVPPAVRAELSRMRSRWDIQGDWIQMESLQGGPQSEALDWQRAGLLDPGEAQAIALAKQVGADWFLTDDAAARLVAEQQGLEVHGSLGVVLGAAALGHLDRLAAQNALNGLFSSTLWLSARVQEQAKAALRKLFPE